MKQFLFLVSFASLFLASCTDPITVGADVLTGDQADVGQVNNLPVEVRTVREDSVRIYSAADNAFIPTFSFGHSRDDVFGEWTHALALTPGLTMTTGAAFVEPIIPEFALEEATLVDSIVVILPIDTFTGFYGSGRTFAVQLSRLAAPIDTDEDLYSAYPRPATLESLTDATSFIATTEATILFDTIYTDGDTITDPHIRLKFTQAFVDEINALDSVAFESEEAFQQIFAGVYLEPTDEVNSFISLAPRPRTQGAFDRSGFYFFYPDSSPTDPGSVYRAPFAGWFPRYTYDFSGSLAGELLAGNGDSQTMVGGTAALMTQVTFTDLAVLQDKLINRAEISFFRDALAEYDYAEFPEPAFLGLYYRNNSGALVNILDQGSLQSGNEAVRNFLGGFREEDPDDTEVFLYRNRLSVHMQGIADGEFAEPTIYVRVVPIGSDPARAVLGGVGAAENPTTNQVTFTTI